MRPAATAADATAVSEPRKHTHKKRKGSETVLRVMQENKQSKRNEKDS